MVFFASTSSVVANDVAVPSARRTAVKGDVVGTGVSNDLFYTEHVTRVLRSSTIDDAPRFRVDNLLGSIL